MKPKNPKPSEPLWGLGFGDLVALGLFCIVSGALGGCLGAQGGCQSASRVHGCMV